MKFSILLVLILATFACVRFGAKDYPRVPSPATSEGRSNWSKKVTLAEIENKLEEESEVELESGEVVFLKVFESVELPSRAQLLEIKVKKEKDDQIWFFDGLDMGYAILREGKVVWVVFTGHEY